MPELQPVWYEAIDKVVEEKQEHAEWDPDEMKSALIEVANGTEQTEAVEGRGFSQPVLSERFKDVKDKKNAIESGRASSSGLFMDPEAEASDEFKQFMDDLNESYDLGLNSMVVRMIQDEIEQSGELPAPMFLRSFLKNTRSGVSQEAEINYIIRRYRGWLEDFRERTGGQMPTFSGATFEGRTIGEDPQQNDPTWGGVPVSQGGGQQQQQQRGSQQQRGGQQSPRQGDDRIDRLEQRVEELTEVVAQSQQQSQQGGMVTIDQGDGVEAQVPVDHPLAMQAMQNGGGDDFIEKLQQAKQAGVIAGPEHLEQASGDDDMLAVLEQAKELGLIVGPEQMEDDGGDEQLVAAIQSSIESLGQKQLQAQKQMSENFTQVMEGIREMEEEDDDLSASDVQEMIEDTLTKNETDRLREEMDDRFETLVDKVEESSSPQSRGIQDPEVIKQDRELEFRERQLENVSENLRYATDQLTEIVQVGVVPAMEKLDLNSGKRNKPLWEPPENRGQQSGQRAPQQGQSTPARDGSQSPQQPETQHPPQQQSDGPDDARREDPDTVTEDQVSNVREKLNLGDGNSDNGVKA